MTTKALRKQLVAAIAMVLVAAVALGSSTYAWFAMNSTVTATGMTVKAKADEGILINEVAAHASESWDDSATGNNSTAILLRATSTANTGTWYSAHSKVSSSAAEAAASTASANLTTGGYTTLTLATDTSQAATGGTQAARTIGYVDTSANSAYDNGEGYYVKYTYYIKSSSDQITCGLAQNAQNLNVAVSAGGTTNSAALDAALRVAVVIGGKAYIFAPVTGADTSYYVNAAANATTAYTSVQATGLGSIPATSADGTQADVYIYFEGEDAGLKTDNVTATLDDLAITVDFSLVTNAAAATDNGVTVSAAP